MFNENNHIYHVLHPQYLDVALSQNLSAGRYCEHLAFHAQSFKSSVEILGLLELWRKTKHNSIFCVVVDAFI